MCTFSYTLNLIWSILMPFRSSGMFFQVMFLVGQSLLSAQKMGTMTNWGQTWGFTLPGQNSYQQEERVVFHPTSSQKSESDISGYTSIISVSFTKNSVPEIHSNNFFPVIFFFQNKQVSQTKIRVISTIAFILAGCIVFVTIPAFIFKYIEGWTALESIYFVVVTLTTVGFGDFVAGEEL